MCFICTSATLFRLKRSPECIWTYTVGPLVISERMNDGIIHTADTWFKRANKKSPENGGAVKAVIGEKKGAWLYTTRNLWQSVTNQALAAAGPEQTTLEEKDPGFGFGDD